MRVVAPALFVLGLMAASPATAQAPVDRVDVALVLAVDVSGSVDDSRFALQMEGIAGAFEDREVQNTILSGQYGALLVTLVNWSQKPQIAVPWRVIASQADAMAFAADVRRAPRRAEDFTCMSLMMQVVGDKVLPLMPVPADRQVVDISGDGRDNCNPRTAVDSIRDGLVADRVTINGLPIKAGREADTIAQWYEQHVIGGAAAFLLPAIGYEDFGRAIRQKFIIEISGQRPRVVPNIASR
jgi:hypothetical protein